MNRKTFLVIVALCLASVSLIGKQKPTINPVLIESHQWLYATQYRVDLTATGYEPGAMVQIYWKTGDGTIISYGELFVDASGSWQSSLMINTTGGPFRVDTFASRHGWALPMASVNFSLP